MAMTAQRVTALPPMDGESIASFESQSPQKSVKDGRPLRMAVSNTPSTPARMVSSSRTQPGIRDYKTPQGPRPPEFASKRVVSDAATVAAATPRRTYLPNATSEPFLGLSARRKTAQYSAATIASTRNKAVVAPPPRSDSLQQPADPFTLTTPSTRQRIISAQNTEASRLPIRDGPSLSGLDLSKKTVRPAESPSRQPSTALRAAQMSMPKPTATATKRQSYIPSAPSFDKLNDILNNSAYTSSENTPPSQLNVSRIGQPSLQTPRIRTTFGIARTASTKLPTRVGAAPPNLLRDDPGYRQASRPLETPRTPSTMQLQAPQPPTERRLSSASAHSGRLLARTVSPTDTKKMKKTASQHPRSPTPELTFGDRSGKTTDADTNQFDALDFTQESTTPDHHIPDGLKSMSSRSSLSSSRTHNSSRPTLANQLSRSSSTRSRTTHSSTGEKTEIVPPVPAIPSGYGSPRDLVDSVFFPEFGVDDLQLNDLSPRKLASQRSTQNLQPSKLMAPAYAFAQHKDTMHETQHPPRHQSQQIRLPPLNLQPISDPTSAKIASLASPVLSEGSSRGGTPPLRRINKTPSTPLTASKATFSAADPRFAYDLDSLPQLRSTTSYGEARMRTLKREQSENSSPNFLSTPSSSNMNFHHPAVPPMPSTASIAADYASAIPAKKTALSRMETDSSSTSSSAMSPVPKALASAAARVSVKPPSGVTGYATDATNPGKPRLVSIRGTSSATPNTSSTSLSRTHSTKEPLLASKSSSNPLSPIRKILASRNSKTLLRAKASRSDLDVEVSAADEEMVKLAAKKKEFGQAAKEVDELHKRAKPKQSMSASQACRLEELNLFERGETIDYKDIYFCGSKNANKLVGDLASQTVNFGFDDERGDYKIVLGDHLAYRYEIIDILGKGSFGQVVRCIDHKTGKLLAIKIIRNKKRFHQQALVEVNILQRLKDWDPNAEHNMLTFTQSFYFRGHLCISTELLSMNLYEFIKAHDFKGFSLRLIRRFTKQMLGSLCLLQSKNVIHCDLKPENILLSHPLQSEIKVIDFGSSCFETERVYTYIQSRFYRSPEVILGMTYGMPIDMWSLGCILAELCTGFPIFPGENEQEQLACIMEVFGPPEKHLVEASTRKKLFFDSLGKPRLTVSSKGKRRRPSTKTLDQVLKCNDEAFLDFVTRCLRWDPSRRLKPDEAMQHDFITGIKRKPTGIGSAVSSGLSSPAKRHTFQTPLRIRPLPEAPAANAKTSIAMPMAASSARQSPVKNVVSNRRHSTLSGLSDQASKRGSTGAVVGSALAQGLPRSVSSRPDMAASAAAIASRQR